MYRGANIDSDHFLVMVNLRQKLSAINNKRSQPSPRLNVDRLKCADVIEVYATALREALPAYNNTAAMHLAELRCHQPCERVISTAAEHKIHVERKGNGWTKCADEHYPRRIQGTPACYCIKPVRSLRTTDD